jgi:hypothetical protein
MPRLGVRKARGAAKGAAKLGPWEGLWEAMGVVQGVRVGLPASLPLRLPRGFVRKPGNLTGEGLPPAVLLGEMLAVLLGDLGPARGLLGQMGPRVGVGRACVGLVDVPHLGRQRRRVFLSGFGLDTGRAVGLAMVAGPVGVSMAPELLLCVSLAMSFFLLLPGDLGAVLGDFQGRGKQQVNLTLPLLLLLPLLLRLLAAVMVMGPEGTIFARVGSISRLSTGGEGVLVLLVVLLLGMVPAAISYSCFWRAGSAKADTMLALELLILLLLLVGAPCMVMELLIAVIIGAMMIYMVLGDLWGGGGKRGEG